MRRDFLTYCINVMAPLGMTPAKHHRIMIAAIQRLIDGKNDRLMLLLPPGSGKSYYSSILLPGWFLAQAPRLTMIAASNTSDLAADFANKAQPYVRDNRDILGYDLRRARSDMWECTNGGEFKAVGCTSAIAGRRGDLAVIDDPFGGRKMADSPATRKEVYDWYRGDLIGRMKPGGRIMLVNTLWHEDDLAGRLIREMKAGGKQWEIVSMQAIYDGRVIDPLGRKVGEAIWPEYESVEQLLEKKMQAGSRDWESQYQQRPSSPEGLLFKAGLLGRVKELPKVVFKRRVRKWDIAGTEEGDGDPDWTVGVLLLETDNRWIVADVIRVRTTVGKVKDLIRKTAEQDGTGVRIILPQDPGSAGKYVAQDFAKALAGFHVTIERETGKKEDRARPFAAQVEAGNVEVLESHWTDRFVEELQMFPAGTHDDQVDAVSGAFNAMIRPHRPAKFGRMNLMGR